MRLSLVRSVLHDVTERFRTRQEIEELPSLAHELSQPLNAILLNTKVALLKRRHLDFATVSVEGLLKDAAERDGNGLVRFAHRPSQFERGSGGGERVAGTQTHFHGSVTPSP